MLHKCANPACSQPFRRLSQGKLFQVETAFLDPSEKPRAGRMSKPPRQVEHFWLCDDCSSILTLTFERGRGMVTVPLPEVAGKKAPRPLRLGDLQPAVEPVRTYGNRIEQ
jgi:hypothetical protein